MTDKTQLKAKSKGQIQNNNLDEHVISTYKKTMKKLEAGKNATTMQGGYLYPIMYKEVLAGEYIKSWDINMLTRLITPLVPTFDKIYITAKAFFVPLTAIWEDAEKELAAKASLETKSGKLPSTTIYNDNTKNRNFKYTLASRYGIPNQASNTEINLMLLRGYRKIWNDYIRNKEYVPADIEWKATEITPTEQTAVNCTWQDAQEFKANAYFIKPSAARKNYFTNIKKTLLSPDSDENQDDISLSTHLDWHAKFQNEKMSVTNATKNDWDIIAEMGGTAPVRTDRVEFLGELDYELNYQQITQSAPMFDEGSSPLGTTGSFSYTRANGTIFSHKQFKQHGHIHILVSVNMDQYSEIATPKELLKTNINDIYRSGLAKKEIQLMYEKEISNTSASIDKASVAYQPAWAEYNRLPTFISGEMQTRRLSKNIEEEPEPISNSQWHNFFPMSDNQLVINTNYFMPTDEINKTLARNNIINQGSWKLGTGPNDNDFFDDPILNMSEHIVEVALPILSEDMKAISKAEELK